MATSSSFATNGPRSGISLGLLGLLLLVLLPSVAPRLRHPIPVLKPTDFAAYYSAALLVREGQGSLIYQGADTGTDPQKKSAPLGSAIDVAARSQGVTDIQMYLYPPFLADVLVPITYVPLATATRLFWVVDALCLLGTVACLIVLLGLPWLGWGSLLLAVSAFCFSPCIGSLMYGQITIVLLFLWTLGTVLYARGYPVLSAVAFALAAALKVTPVLVLLPFLVWKRWSWVATFVATLAVITAGFCWINTPHALAIFVGKVAPAMSRSIPEIVNNTLNAGTQMMLWALKGHPVVPDPAALPHGYMIAGKLAAYSFLGLFLLLILKNWSITDRRSQVLTLALIGLAAPLSSPVSWEHAYTTSFLLLALLWHEALRQKLQLPYLVLLSLCTVMLDSYIWRAAVLNTAHAHHAVLSATLQLGGLLLFAVLVLWRMNTLPGLSSTTQSLVRPAA